jgi:hypothetical protein
MYSPPYLVRHRVQIREVETVWGEDLARAPRTGPVDRDHVGGGEGEGERRGNGVDFSPSLPVSGAGCDVGAGARWDEDYGRGGG